MIRFVSDIKSLAVCLTIKTDGKTRDVKAVFDNGKFSTNDELIADELRKLPIVKEVISEPKAEEALKKPAVAAKKPKASAKK